MPNTKVSEMRDLVFKITYDKTLEKWVVWEKIGPKAYSNVGSIPETTVKKWLKRKQKSGNWLKKSEK